jgi:Erv1 / Alr family
MLLDYVLTLSVDPYVHPIPMNIKRTRVIIFTTTILLLIIVAYKYSTLPSLQVKFKPQKAPIMSKMGNETLKQELGRSSWKLLHTMSVKFPLKPTLDEKEAYLDFLGLFARLYPCGDCASHFQMVLLRYPPRLDSRKDIAEWTCEAHNVVNDRLGKPSYNCTGIEKKYLCGCDEGSEEE